MEFARVSLSFLRKVGGAKSVGPVRKALLDENEDVRRYAINGLKRALEAGYLAETCRELFPDLQRLVRAGQNVSDAAALLIDFDRTRACEFLSSAEVFTAANENLSQLLNPLYVDQACFSRETLLRLISEFNGRALDNRKAFALHDALHLLGSFASLRTGRC
jgi:hypothetical protein